MKETSHWPQTMAKRARQVDALMATGVAFDVACRRTSIRPHIYRKYRVELSAQAECTPNGKTIESLAGRILPSNLPDSDKVELLRRAYT